MERCFSYKGTGYTTVEIATHCTACHGSGQKHGRACPVCYGRAKTPLQMHTRCLECDALGVMTMNGTVAGGSGKTAKPTGELGIRSLLPTMTELFQSLRGAVSGMTAAITRFNL